VNLALGARGGGSGRQPGSSFKPIVAAAALESGIGLQERYESSPARFSLGGGETWTVPQTGDKARQQKAAKAQAEAYLEGCSMADLARRVLETHIKDVVDRTEIRQAMEARARYQGIEDGSVRSLEGPSSTAT
jgi:membrane peptidoglycan carboxypeptidase